MLGKLLVQRRANERVPEGVAVLPLLQEARLEGTIERVEERAVRDGRLERCRGRAKRAQRDRGVGRGGRER